MRKKTYILKKLTTVQRVGLVTVGILLIPLLGKWPWGVLDFMVMGAVIFATGCLLAYVAQNVDPKKRVYAVAAVVCGFFIIWAELAVGLVSQLVTGELWIFDYLK